MDMQFVCPCDGCQGTVIEEVVAEAIQYSDVIRVNDDPRMDCLDDPDACLEYGGEIHTEDGSVARYQCKSCGYELGTTSAQLLETLRGLPVNKRFLIKSEMFTEELEPITLYWSNTGGINGQGTWVAKLDADLFTTQEKETLNLPLEGEWEEIISEEKPMGMSSKRFVIVNENGKYWKSVPTDGQGTWVDNVIEATIHTAEDVSCINLPFGEWMEVPNSGP